MINLEASFTVRGEYRGDPFQATVIVGTQQEAQIFGFMDHCPCTVLSPHPFLPLITFPEGCENIYFNGNRNPEH